MSIPSIGIVICNFNKCSYVLNCIQSVLESDTSDYSIYVVDNASTDHSVSEIQKRYGSQLQLLINSENLGGSGGFNRGIRAALKAGHPYIMCLDNDVLVDESAVRSLLDCMQEHKEIGILGSRVYHMEEPDYVQQFGLNIDFENYIVDTLYANVPEDGTIPELVFCDTVATCSVLVRTEAILKAGIMPEDNFIYWDDMEWGYRIQQAGYRAAVYGRSKILHTKGASNRNNAVFTNYYSIRNQIHFFMKYIKEDQLEDFAAKMLNNVFDTIYECMYRDEHCAALAVRYGLEDAMYGIRGKAEPYKLENQDVPYQRLTQILENSQSYYIEENGNSWLAGELREYIQNHYPEKREQSISQADVILSLCSYIMNVKDYSLEKVYIDEYYNVFSKKEEAELIQNYAFSKALFLYMNQPVFLENIRKLRKKYVE
ncbi:MAG: glycosyltransferase family 2 protein [Lachnospiraceae bacterium]|nr:glycosyltransferase family 2 protein [Lachnospiraceae bacterium]